MHAQTAAEDVLAGDQLLRRALQKVDEISARRGETIISPGKADPAPFLIRSGLAYRTATFADGRRAITDIFLPGDIVGIENIVVGRSPQAIIAAHDLRYCPLSATVIRRLKADSPQIAICVLALVAEIYRRADQHIVALTRLDAHARIAAFLLSISDRLLHRGFITRPTFNLRLTQEEIADHLGITMVHMSRTLRRMREETLVIVASQAVIILDLDRLREVSAGLTPKTESRHRRIGLPLVGVRAAGL